MDVYSLMREQEADDLAHCSDAFSKEHFVVKNIRSEQIGPEVCAELDLDTGAVTIVDSAFGVELSANSVLLLARFISENAPIVAAFVLKAGE